SLHGAPHPCRPPPFPTRRSSDLSRKRTRSSTVRVLYTWRRRQTATSPRGRSRAARVSGSPVRRSHCGARASPRSLTLCTVCTKRSEEHTSELQSLAYLVCRLLLE